MPREPRSQRNLLIGDVLQIHTKKGFVYAQCTHKLPFFGHLIRILPGFHKIAVDDIEGLASETETFYTFVLWNKDVDRKKMHIVGRTEVPERCQPLPLFKGGTVDPKIKKISAWWLWDGKKEWYMGKLKKDQKDLPMRLIMSYESLIYRLEIGWHPRDEA